MHFHRSVDCLFGMIDSVVSHVLFGGPYLADKPFVPCRLCSGMRWDMACSEDKNAPLNAVFAANLKACLSSLLTVSSNDLLFLSPCFVFLLCVPFWL